MAFRCSTREIAARRRALLERFEGLAQEAHDMRHPFEQVVAHMDRFRKIVIDSSGPRPFRPSHCMVASSPHLGVRRRRSKFS